jgi:CRP/FNR family cyclic AMP-dependent transcriptional regulator
MPQELLRKIPLFSELSDDQLRKVQDLCERRRYEAGVKVISEGEEGDEMFIVVEGKVEVSKAITFQAPGQDHVKFEKQLVVLREGNYFGEVALLASDTRSATVTALSDLDVWVLQGAPIQKLMAQDFELGYRLLSVMSRELCVRLGRANEDIRKLMTAFAIAINR